MNDPEFIELLNLYVDHEISSEDAARLEAEVQRNPARRRTYQQYCRMQNACRMLARDFQPEAAVVAERKVVNFEAGVRRAARFPQFAAIGAMAAAACLTVIFVVRNRESAGVPADSVVVAGQPAAAPVATGLTIAPGAMHAVKVPEGQPAMVSNPLLLTGRAQADAMLAAAVEQTDTKFEWMRMVQLEPIQPRRTLDGLRFENPRPASPEPGSRTYRSPQPVEGSAEWVGFRFNK